MSTTTDSIRVGLRFRRSSARTLRNLADRVRSAELGGQHVATFELAAEAAASGEPLIVECSDPMEAVLMAEGYAQFGVARPSIEQLSGS